MIGSTEFLTNLHKENGGQVTFGDGAKGSVVGRGDLNVQGLPKLKNVLLVDGLKANLISISQLCDQNLHVKFTKDGCQVMDDKHISILEGTRTGTVSTVTGTSEATSVDKPEVTLAELSIEESLKDMEVSYTETQESASAKENSQSNRVQKNHLANTVHISVPRNPTGRIVESSEDEEDDLSLIIPHKRKAIQSLEQKARLRESTILQRFRGDTGMQPSESPIRLEEEEEEVEGQSAAPHPVQVLGKQKQRFTHAEKGKRATQAIGKPTERQKLVNKKPKPPAKAKNARFADAAAEKRFLTVIKIEFVRKES
ncbi:hypothetical protein H6P81_016499 [Aristolochia fimbriata]|uniref:Retrovirus-related Pol polyprotein from transposon TNT 1-94-like beta-barrel domain-containing protein n=1 Tax=Aristolochia fimbriata TaxID=158543 RepID=A0AAV7E8W7_ARIFI|nr:hypothetical protein H6P81_016499 [Aristolochia fimbriata]